MKCIFSSSSPKTSIDKRIYDTRLSTQQKPMVVHRKPWQLEITLPISHEYIGNANNYHGPVIFEPGNFSWNSQLRFVFTVAADGELYIKVSSFANTDLFDYGEHKLFDFFATFVKPAKPSAGSHNPFDQLRLSHHTAKFHTEKWKIPQTNISSKDDEQFQNPVPFYRLRIDKFREDCLNAFKELPGLTEAELKLFGELDGLMIGIFHDYSAISPEQYDRAIALIKQLKTTDDYQKVPFNSCMTITKVVSEASDEVVKFDLEVVQFDLESLTNDLGLLKEKTIKARLGAHISQDQLVAMLTYMSSQEGFISEGGWYPAGTVARIANELQKILPAPSLSDQLSTEPNLGWVI